MPTYDQAQRPLAVTTPLGENVLLLVGFSGHDRISQPFGYQAEMLAENKTEIAFDKILGQKVTVTLRWGEKKERYFNGICSRFSQGERDDRFTRYRMEIVPKLWLLARKAQSRTFQHKSVPDILKKVLTGFTVQFELKGTFEPRDYCVQYRETDFHFAARLMEEEGIYYFFTHSKGDHTMVVANSPSSHAEVPVQSQVPYEETFGGEREELRVASWEKTQELRSGKVTLWDHSFELPHKHLESEKTIQESVAAGSVSHKLKVADNDKLEIYDFPGEYAQRFDGVNEGGGDQPSEIQKIFTDNKRTVEIRMQQEALASLEAEGKSNCRQFTSGQKFTLQRHFNANGSYVLTAVEHSLRSSGDYRAGSVQTTYRNSFWCIPEALPFRPPRLTPKPTVLGTQTAVVVGPSGEEIFTDKYGRVKVQFHWDREGKHDAGSSCWIRVASTWAGKQWGMVQIPRIGQEVLVDFLEGDPDQPIIVGSVYNADMMPPYQLPANKTQSGLKSRSSLGGSPSNYNEIRFEDKKGSEQLLVHAEKNQDIEVENNETHWVGHDRTKTIDHNETTHVKYDRTETVDNNETITIHMSRTETVNMNESITIGENRTEQVGINETVTIGAAQTLTVGAAQAVSVGAAQAITVGGARTVTVGGVQTYAFGAAVTIGVAGNMATSVDGKQSTSVKGDQNEKVGGDRSASVNGSEAIEASGKVSIKSNQEISLGCGASSIKLKPSGQIEIEGLEITLKGAAKVEVSGGISTEIKGAMVQVQGGLVKIN